MKKLIVVSLCFLSACSNFGQRRSAVKSNSSSSGFPYHMSVRGERPAVGRANMLSAQRQSALSVRGIPQKKMSSLELLTPDSLKKLNEKQLFAELMDRHQAQDRWAFDIRYRLFLKKYPKSVKLDEVYYMKGIMELAERNYGFALVQFNRILKTNPYGKKAPAALFAKGIVYKRMNLQSQAQQVLKEIGKRYPGSPESMRAQVELKLIRK